jgi:hypothetical protein
LTKLVLDSDSSVSETYGQQQGAAGRGLGDTSSRERSEAGRGEAAPPVVVSFPTQPSYRSALIAPLRLLSRLIEAMGKNVLGMRQRPLV